ncbi:hypothetical protein CLV93_1231, partial [Prolixibacter denitrificans]
MINRLIQMNTSCQSSRLPRQQKLTGKASHTTVRTGLVYGGSLNH